MLLEELFQEGLAGSRVRNIKNKIQRKFDRTGEYIDPKAQAAEMQARVDAIQNEVGPNEYMQGMLDNLRSSSDPEKKALADKIEDNYYHGEAGWSGQTPHQQAINQQTGASQWQAERAWWASLTQQEREAEIARIDAEKQKKREAEKAKKEAEEAKKAAEEAEKERKRCENPNALLCP